MRGKSLEQLRISPMGKESGRLRIVFDYFGQKAPGIDSGNAACELDQDSAASAFSQMIEVSNIKSSSIWVCDRRTKKLTVADTQCVDIRTPMIYCHKRGNENELHAMLRHLRNSIAHGNTFALFGATNILVCFQDFERDGRPSACITTNRATLKRWMKLLKQASKTNGL